MIQHFDDTIAAISTPVGEGGIGVIRISGEKAVHIAEKIFCHKRNRSLKNFRVHCGNVVDPENMKVIDEVILLLMKSPHSYTMEDVVEIQCHSGVVTLLKIMEIVLRHGARMALPGEFTKRAYLNGRIDILQAEAVIDIVRSKTERSLEIAQDQLAGKTSSELYDLRNRLIGIIASIEAPLDFSEEEVLSLEVGHLEEMIGGLINEMKLIIEKSKTGKIYRDGAKVIIAGKPNVGKSSLLNTLIGEKRVIVTEYPGTTRDSVSEWININGIPVIVYDTAGIRETDDEIEREGVKRSEELIKNSDFVIIVVDLSCHLTDEDMTVIKLVNEQLNNFMIVFNKSDLEQCVRNEDIESMSGMYDTVTVSSLTGEGIEQLKSLLSNKLSSGFLTNDDGCIICKARHREAVEKSYLEVENALDALRKGFSGDIILINLKRALYLLGDIFGENFDEAVLDRIFSEFCIGK